MTEFRLLEILVYFSMHYLCLSCNLECKYKHYQVQVLVVSLSIRQKDGKELLWPHIIQIYELSTSGRLRMPAKITNDHVHLTSASRMSVRYAAQVEFITVCKVRVERIGFLCSQLGTKDI